MNKPWQPYAEHILPGDIDPKTVQAVVTSHLGALERCIKQMLA
jgi:hypothetical protein